MDDDKAGPQLVGAWQQIVGGGDVQAILTEEAHKAVLESTRSFLKRVDVKALDEMRKSFELPPEALGALIEIHAKKLADSDAAKPAPFQTGRQVLPLSSGDQRIKPGASAVITARPQRVAFRPERFYVSDAWTPYKIPWWKRLWTKTAPGKGAADWVINDIMIGNRSQFAQAGDIPGDMFSSNATDGFVSFETAQVAMDVKIVVTYIGPNPGGEIFYASMIGMAAF